MNLLFKKFLVAASIALTSIGTSYAAVPASQVLNDSVVPGLTVKDALGNISTSGLPVANPTVAFNTTNVFTVTDGVSNATSKTFTSPSKGFTRALVGQLVVINGLGSGSGVVSPGIYNNPIVDTIASVAADFSSITVTNTAATNSLSSLIINYGIDQLANLNAAIVNAAPTLPNKQRTIYLAQDIIVSAQPTNTYLVPITGPGRILVATAGLGFVYDYIDAGSIPLTDGSQYLFALHNKQISRTAFTIRLLGDSTTAGNSVTGDFIPATFMQNQAYARGAHLATVNGFGHPGVSTAQWIINYPTELSTCTDGVVVGYGINGPYYDNSRTIEQKVVNELAAMNTALSTMRANCPIATESIILTVPSSTSDTPNDRDDKWYSLIEPGYYALSKKYQTGFVDKYKIQRDSTNSVGFRDQPYSYPAGVHPLNASNAVIWRPIADMSYNMGVLDNGDIGAGRYNISGTTILPDCGVVPPASWPYGISIYRAVTNCPYNGGILSVHHDDDDFFQIDYDYVTPYVNSYSVRTGTLAGWNGWVKNQQPTSQATSVIQGSTTAGTYTYDNTLTYGYYTVANNQVSLYIGIKVTAVTVAGTGTGSQLSYTITCAGCTNVPAANASDGALPFAFFPCSFSGITLDASYTSIVASIAAGSNIPVLNEIGSGQTRQALPIAKFIAGSEVHCMVIYPI